MKTLKAGDTMPEWEVTDQDGNTVSAKDFKGRKLVIFFYPKANTPGCTTEACNLRDHYAELRKAGYELLGVSADSQSKQANFKKKFNFPFPLLADTEQRLISAFGVWGPKKFMGREYEGIHRMTFVINKDGIVERVIDKVKTADHAAQILE